MFAVEEAAGKALSLTVKPNCVFGKGVVGVPTMAPLSASNVRPGGNAGFMPPRAGGMRGCLEEEGNRDLKSVRECLQT